MDERKERIGEHAAEQELAWAVGALGPVPEDPVGWFAGLTRIAAAGGAQDTGRSPAGGDGSPYGSLDSVLGVSSVPDL